MLLAWFALLFKISIICNLFYVSRQKYIGIYGIITTYLRVVLDSEQVQDEKCDLRVTFGIP